ncbi:Transposase and inactivated derivatives, partial [Chitinophaga rupis]
MKGKSLGPPPIYAETLKISVAREYLSTDQSYGELAKKYGLKNREVVRSMVSWYERHYSQDQLPVVKNAPAVGSPDLKAGASNTDKEKQLKEALLKV